MVWNNTFQSYNHDESNINRLGREVKGNYKYGFIPQRAFPVIPVQLVPCEQCLSCTGCWRDKGGWTQRGAHKDTFGQLKNYTWKWRVSKLKGQWLYRTLFLCKWDSLSLCCPTPKRSQCRFQLRRGQEDKNIWHYHQEAKGEKPCSSALKLGEKHVAWSTERSSQLFRISCSSHREEEDVAFLKPDKDESMGTLGYGVGSGNDQITGILLIFPLQLHGWGAVSFGPWGRVLQKGLQVCSKEISFIWHNLERSVSSTVFRNSLVA